MKPQRLSVAMTGPTASRLRDHLLRPDGQEDVSFATYSPSTGLGRDTVLLSDLILPTSGERSVHGNASFTGDYVMRATEVAQRRDAGIVLLHTHPGGRGWQMMSHPDADAERSYAYLVHELTGLPLVGMTLAGGDGTWSARSWNAEGDETWAESVRVVDAHLQVSWNDALRPVPPTQHSQLRTVSGWGDRVQGDITRLRVLVVGLGSVGLEVALRLAATGIETVGLMDFDTVEVANLDRLIGASPIDVWLGRAKVDLARRLVVEATTAADPKINVHDLSICEPAGLAAALDYDLIFSCVDRPWARAVLNTLAYSDLIPVIDGGIHIDPFPDQGMRNATWRTHVIRPGRPCLACNGQLDAAAVPLDREGLLDDPAYIAQSDLEAPARQNVAALSVSVVGALLAQFVSLVVAPGGSGEPGPLQYVLSTHTQEHLTHTSRANCAFEAAEALGNTRPLLVGTHRAAEDARADRHVRTKRLDVRLGRQIDRMLLTLRRQLTTSARARIARDRNSSR
jgi:hypothetical protein